MIRINKKITITLFIAMLMLVNSVPVFGAEKYVHNPMENPKAAADIVVNPNAVYGYSPSPYSERLKEYADYDWSDPVFVEEMRKQREEYHDSIKELYGMITAMKTAGADIKDIAIAVSTRRNEIRLESYKNDPVGLAKVKKRHCRQMQEQMHALECMTSIMIHTSLRLQAHRLQIINPWLKRKQMYIQWFREIR